MGRMKRMFLSRREFFAVSGVAVTAAAAASGCMKQGANLIATAATVKKKDTKTETRMNDDHHPIDEARPIRVIISPIGLAHQASYV